MFNRIVNIPKNKSFFLFGPRGSGKSTLLGAQFPRLEALWVDLLDAKQEETFSLHPEEFKNLILSQKPSSNWVVVDEIQKCPKLLNYVHQLIETEGLCFALTGSSARRLKQKGVNLLAGRAFVRHLHPLTSAELAESVPLQKLLESGSLPEALKLTEADDCKDFLRAYALTYVKEEIQNEQWVRKLDPFRRFLQVAAQMNGKIINASSIGKDVGAETATVQSYYQILEDTLMGFELPAYHRSIRKQQRKAPKFYLFDPGVKRALDKTLDIPLLPTTSAFGEAFEHWVVLELHRMQDYRRKDFTFSYLLTKDDAEIDLICERPGMPTALIEIKSTERVHEAHAQTLNRMIKDFHGAEAFVLSRDRIEKKFGKVRALPYLKGIQEIVGG